MSLRRMLAVAHEASFTGAPIQLLRLLEWIRRSTDVEVHTVVMDDGPLRPRFETLGGVTVLDKTLVGTVVSMAERGLVNLGSRRVAPAVAAARLRPQLHGLRGFDLVYLNSFTTVEVLPHLPGHGAVVSHVHELPFAIRSYPRPAMLDVLRTRPDRWVAVCDEVRAMLVGELGTDPARVRVHHPFIDTAPLRDLVVSPAENARRRHSVGIPPDAAVVMGSGTIDWRKGPELFVQLAGEVSRRTDRPVHFVWIGGVATGPDWERVRSDMERSGVDNVHFVGTKREPGPWFAMADVFALTSHEDPFPLVCEEHAVMGHPIVTYRNGGIVELLEGAGPEAATGVVDHLDVGSMASRVVVFLDHDGLRVAAGAQLRNRVLELHDTSTAAPRLFADLTDLVDHTRARH